MQEKISIFLIEDDYQDAIILKDLLESSHDHIFNIGHATVLGDAINKLESSRVDLIITDLGLPDSTHLDTLNTLNEYFPNIPIIVLTGSAGNENGNMAVSLGAQDYHIKGQIHKESLIKSIHYAIERKKSEIRLKDSESKYRDLSFELEETNMLKELLLDVVTHDLKNNAGSISTLSDILTTEENQDPHIEMIKEASSNILNIIRSTSSLSRITSGEQIKYEEINLRELIENIIDEYSDTISRYGFKVKFDGDDNIILSANPIISEIFRNFISNVFEHAWEGKYLKIETEVLDKQFVCRFLDKGDLIKPEHREAIFKRRFQVNKRSSKGSGLGLAIANRIAHAHSGNVWVESYDSGNCFCFSMPCG